MTAPEVSMALDISETRAYNSLNSALAVNTSYSIISLYNLSNFKYAILNSGDVVFLPQDSFNVVDCFKLSYLSHYV